MIENICWPCVHFSVCLIIPMNQVMGGPVLMFKCISFLDVFTYCELLLLLVPLQTYISWNKKWALLVGLLEVK